MSRETWHDHNRVTILTGNVSTAGNAMGIEANSRAARRGPNTRSLLQPLDADA